jgi:hypothetical protein
MMSQPLKSHENFGFLHFLEPTFGTSPKPLYSAMPRATVALASDLCIMHGWSTRKQTLKGGMVQVEGVSILLGVIWGYHVD